MIPAVTAATLSVNNRLSVRDKEEAWSVLQQQATLLIFQFNAGDAPSFEAGVVQSVNLQLACDRRVSVLCARIRLRN